MPTPEEVIDDDAISRIMEAMKQASYKNGQYNTQPRWVLATAAWREAKAIFAAAPNAKNPPQPVKAETGFS